jgi:hypothetical protein
MSSRAAAWLAAFQVAVAAGLSVLLSTWTYLIGKGLIMSAGEMDMGMDDLPADTIRQVAASFVASFAIWACLLVLALGIAAAVADVLYRDDRQGYAVALRRTAIATIWFVVWAAAVLALNSIRHDEIRHPAAAVRAYAQGNQHWFSGSSAAAPGKIEPEPLAGRGRLRGIAVLFPVLWSVSLPLPAGRRRMGRPALWGAAILLSWVAWWGVWRLLPWAAIEALTG